MTTALEIVTAPFFMVVDFVLAAPAAAIVVVVCVVGVLLAAFVAMA